VEPTADRSVCIEARAPGYVRYRAVDGRRWEVRGTCIRLGHCLVGAVVRTPGGLVQVASLAHLAQLQQQLGVARIDSPLDVPVAPGFTGCCPLEITCLAD
jgi:hypothetical protein